MPDRSQTDPRVILCSVREKYRVEVEGEKYRFVADASGAFDGLRLASLLRRAIEDGVVHYLDDVTLPVETSLSNRLKVEPFRSPAPEEDRKP